MSTVDNNTIFIHVESGRYPLTLQNLKQENPLVGFPPSPQESSINNLGYAVVDRTAPPEQYTGVLIEDPPIIDPEDGRYKQVWNTRPFTPEELAEMLATARGDCYNRLEEYRFSLYNGGVSFTDSDSETFSVHIHDQSVQALVVTATRALIEKDVVDPVPTYIVHDVNLDAFILGNADMLALYKLVSEKHDDAIAKVTALQQLIDNAQTIEDLPEIPPVVE